MRKVLIIRFSSIGDIVLTTPVIRCLKTQLNVEVHYITKDKYACILEDNPYVDKVFSIDKKSNSLKKIVKLLKLEKYSIIVDLHKNFRSKYICFKLGIKPLVYDKINRQKLLFTKFKIDKLPDLHIVDRYLETVKPLRIKNDGKGLDYHIPIMDYIIPQHLDIRLKSGHFVAFVIGATHATKRLPAKKIKSICEIANKELIVLIGGKEDIEASLIIEQAGNHIINLCGKLNLHQSASIIDQARVVVAHDTGFMHIAAALKRPVISIWGNTVPKFGMYPYFPTNSTVNYKIIENTTLSCRPCSKLGQNYCPKDHFKCMNDLINKQIADTFS
ncbi:MAG: glycosyltransferase family 9 protein [Saprospiraceae bacterium]|nr:glycosyltransferase family 9 protein [Saprospiraceae bacterium]